MSSSVYSLKLVAYTNSVEIYFAEQAQLQNHYILLVGEEPQKNWVLWASLFNYWIQGHDPLLATVILVILIQHFLGILCVTEFQVTQTFEKFISWLHGHPISITNKFQEFLW